MSLNFLYAIHCFGPWRILGDGNTTYFLIFLSHHAILFSNQMLAILIRPKSNVSKVLTWKKNLDYCMTSLHTIPAHMFIMLAAGYLECREFTIIVVLFRSHLNLNFDLIYQNKNWWKELREIPSSSCWDHAVKNVDVCSYIPLRVLNGQNFVKIGIFDGHFYMKTKGFQYLSCTVKPK